MQHPRSGNWGIRALQRWVANGALEHLDQWHGLQGLEPRLLMSTTALAVDDAFTAYQDQSLVVAIEGASRLRMFSEPGDYVGQGQSYNFTEKTGDFQLFSGSISGITLFYRSSGHNWTVSMAPISGQPLVPGVYEDARRYPFHGRGNPGLSVSGDGRGSNGLTGRFVVHEAVYDVDGRVLRFVAEFEQHSEGATPALFGTIEYNAPPSVPGTVLANDATGGTRTASVLNGPANGSLTFQPTGEFIYTPSAGYLGTDSFTYQATINGVVSDPATVHLNVVQAPPVASDLLLTLAEDTSIARSLRATDPTADPLTFRIIQGPSDGVLQLSDDGSFVYTPAADFNGRDYFRFVANDGAADSVPKLVVLDVTAVEDSPSAQDDHSTTELGQPLVVRAAGFNRLVMVSEPGEYIGQGLSYDLNDNTGLFGAGHLGFGKGIRVSYSGPASSDFWHVEMDAPGDQLIAEGFYDNATRYPYNGLNPGLSVTGQHRGHNTSIGNFTIHQLEYNEDGSVRHVVADFVQHGGTSTGGSALRGTVEFNSAQNSEAGLLGNDHDADGQDIVPVLVTGPAHGLLTLNDDGTFTYVPDAAFVGVDAFTYRTFDGVNYSSIATVTFDVTNDAPVAADSQAAGSEDQPIQGTAMAADANGNPLAFSVASNPQHGTLELNADGTFTYTPAANFHGQDSFTFTASDGVATSNAAAVQLTILPVNDAPVAFGESFRIRQAATLTLPPPGLLANDSDIDGDGLTVSVQTAPAGGTLVLNADGSLTYSAAADFTGVDTFSYLVSDGDLTTPATVNIEVVPFLGPSALVATVEASSVVLNWIDNTGGFADAFQIERSAAPKGKHGLPVWELVGSSSLTSFTDTNVSGGSWLYRVRAIADNITSSYSNVVELKVQSVKRGGGKRGGNANDASLAAADLLLVDSTFGTHRKRGDSTDADDAGIIDLLSLVNTGGVDL